MCRVACVRIEYASLYMQTNSTTVCLTNAGEGCAWEWARKEPVQACVGVGVGICVCDCVCVCVCLRGYGGIGVDKGVGVGVCLCACTCECVHVN